MPLLPVPTVRQRRDHTCGLACARAVLRFHGRPDPRPFATPQDGADPRTLEGVFRLNGLRVLSGEVTVPDLRHFCMSDRPPVCLIQLAEAGVGHYVVVTGVTARRVYFMDPARGPRWLPIAEWLRYWHDTETGMPASVFVRWAVVAWPETCP